MPAPIMIDPNYGEKSNQMCGVDSDNMHGLLLTQRFCVCGPSEICPENISPSEGLSALNALLEKKMGHGVARLLDNLFDMFYN